MEGKWTRGPWRAEYDNDTGPGDEGFWEFLAKFRRRDGLAYAILDASGHGIGRFDDEKDAKLAVQAPAMADALEKVARFLWEEGYTTVNPIVAEVDALLTAIKGE